MPAARVSDKLLFHLGNLIEEGDTSKIFTKPDNQKQMTTLQGGLDKKMQHTDKNYEIQMNSINEKLIKMSSILEEQFIKALKVLSTRDENLANDIIETDKQINDLNAILATQFFKLSYETANGR